MNNIKNRFFGAVSNWLLRRSIKFLSVLFLLSAGLFTLTLFIIDPLPFLDEMTLFGFVLFFGKAILDKRFAHKEVANR